MGFGSAIKSCFSNYATFTGRARRAEFWLFYLFTLLVGMMGFAAAMVTAFVTLPMNASEGDPSTGGLVAYLVVLGLIVVVSIVLAIPLYAAWARRLHDMGQSGHWLWLNLASLGIVPLIMAFMDSERGTNRWGPDPKAAERGPDPYAAGYGQPQPNQVPPAYQPPPAPPQ